MKMRWWLPAFRVILGIVFIIASVSKLSALSRFVIEVAGYDLLPFTLARIYGVALPWVELTTGCALILGVFLPFALVISILMAASFTVANIYAFYQGASDNCGCFGELIPLSHTASLIIDVVMILTAAIFLFYRKKLTFMTINILISKYASRIHRVPKYLVKRISQFVILIILVLAIGVPLSCGETKSLVNAEIDSILEQGRPALLFFYSEGCGECEQQKPVIDNLEQQYGEWLGFIRIDYKAESSVAVEFEVTRAPRVLIIGDKTENGYVVLQSFHDFVDKESLQRSLYQKLGSSICDRFGPVVEFSTSPLSGNVPIKVQFTDSSLGDILSWAWDFNNDGNVDSTLQNPSYIFNKSGNYTVSLTVNGTCGSRTEIKEKYLEFISIGCNADFSAEPTEVGGVKPIQFFDNSSGEVISWQWDFNNDGKIDSTEPNPVYTYKKNGEYSVSLSIKTSNCEDKITKTKFIKVKGCAG
jgi:PKD repeat protein/uncharacterized membrane protein YphA (DoxX/SURF4 family)